MRFYGWLLRRHVTQFPGRAAAGWLALTVAAAAMLALAGMGAALRFRLGAHLAELFPEERLTLEAGRLALGPVALDVRPIDDAALAAVRARPEVDAAWAVEPVRVPVRIEGTLFGQGYTSDAVVYGVPRELIDDALAEGQPWDPAPDGTLPVVVSRYFLDIYNLGLAPANKMPLLTPSAVIGRRARLVVGESAIGLSLRSAEPIVRECRVAGLSARPTLLGLAVPAAVVREWNRRLADAPEPTYVQVVVRLRRGADRDAFEQWAAGLGLRPAGGERLGEQLKAGVRAAGWALIALAGAVLALGLLIFYQLFALTFHARRLDSIRLRALGLSPRGAAAVALGEAAILALAAVASAGAIVGLAGHRLASAWRGVERTAAWLPPGLLEPPPTWLLAAAGSAILLLSLLPALPMLRWVVRVEPAQVIRDL